MTENGYTCRAITLRGSEQEQVTLRITLENSSHNPFVLTTPYVLTEADTQVTASFALDTFGRNVIKKPVALWADGAEQSAHGRGAGRSQRNHHRWTPM